jgi:replicative DNA helicase
VKTSGSRRTRQDGSRAREDEAAFLGAVLATGSLGDWRRKGAGVRSADFRVPAHRAVFVAINTLTSVGKPLTEDAIVLELVRAHGMAFDDAGRAIALLIARAPRQPHVAEYARRLRERREQSD